MADDLTECARAQRADENEWSRGDDQAKFLSPFSFYPPTPPPPPSKAWWQG